MNRLSIIAVLFVATLSAMFAQDARLGKVTVEELKTTKSEIDTSAVAEILYVKANYVILYDSEGMPQLHREVETKIKIYKKEGYDWANHSISIYTAGGSSETGYYTDAYTYNLVNGKVQKTKLKSEGEFKEKINEYWERRKISMPDVKEGSVVEFKYVTKTAFIADFEWQFQYSIPVVYNEFNVSTPESFIYNIRQKSTMSIPFEEKLHQNSIQKFNERKRTYRVYFQKPYKNESYVSNLRNYLPSISYELASVRYSNGSSKNFAMTWEDVAKNIFNNESFGKEIEQKNYFEVDLNAALKDVTGNTARMYAAFDFVKNRMNWNERNGTYCEFGVKKAYKEKIGNVADINLMLVAIFRYLGLNSDPVLVSTRDNGIAFFPNRTAYNYVVVAVRTENGTVLFDATSNNAMPNLLPIRTLNWFGRMITKDGRNMEIDLMPTQLSKLNYTSMITINEDGSISGKSREQLFDYYGLNFRDRYANFSESAHLERLEKANKGVDFEDFKVLNKTDLAKPIGQEYSFTSNAKCDVIGNNIYFKPLLFHAFDSNPFTSETRDYPIDFTFPRQDKYAYTFTIPEGYVVESLPQSTIVTFEKDMVNFKFHIAQRGQTIQISSSLDFNVPIIGSNYYATLKDFFAKVVEKMNEQIVLKKA